MAYGILVRKGRRRRGRDIVGDVVTEKVEHDGGLLLLGSSVAC